MAEAAFSGIYARSGWSAEGDGSGGGSTLDYTRHVARLLEALVQRLDVATLLDCPCGSGVWMAPLVQRLQRARPALAYIGVDVAAEALARAGGHFRGVPNVALRRADVAHDALPALPRKGSLVFSRDMLQHLPLRDGQLAVRAMAATGAEYLAINSYLPGNNKDVPYGGYYDVNLLLPPFALAPEWCFAENFEHVCGGSARYAADPHKHLLVFRGDALRAALDVSRAATESHGVVHL